MEGRETKADLQQLVKTRQIEEARALCDRLCASMPGDADIWFMSAGIHAELGNIEGVIDSCEKVTSLRPDAVIAHYNLGVAMLSQGRYTEAENSLRQALKLDPRLYSAVIALGLALLRQGRADDSVTVYRHLLEFSSELAPALIMKANANLSLALCELKRFTEAEQAARNALDVDPASAITLNNLGQALKEQGRLEEAAELHRRAIVADPGYAVAHSNLLLDLNYLTSISNREIFEAHCQWASQHAAEIVQTRHARHEPASGRRLRIGYVSPDFRAHSVVLFAAGLIEQHDRDRFEIYCYSNVKKPDAWTARVSEVTDHWREISYTSDEEVAQQVVEDGIDILVDLAGHTANNRLLAFAGKPAPVQVTWLGYPNTTGMTAIDYRLTDEQADPVQAGNDFYTESLVRLPQGFLCYRPLHDCPDVNPLPMKESGNIVFGCFNNSAKVNPDVIGLWSRILREIPGSRLLLKSYQLTDPAVRDGYLAAFAHAGVEQERIEVRGRIASTIEHLALYHQVDVALDPFPYNGTTTTCEALWMGVPVVVLAGNSHAGRVGVSLLASAGLEEFIAASVDDYVRLCVELSANSRRLAEMRAGMRARLEGTPLLDTASFARHVESAYLDMWAVHTTDS